MLFWTIQTAIASFIFIFLVHSLINFFKSTLTVPKIKDLVNTPTQKYENIYKIISHNNNKQNQDDQTNHVEQYSIADLLPTTPNTNTNTHVNVNTTTPIDQNNMKNELKNFLKSQMNAPQSSMSMPIASISSSASVSSSTTNISDLVGPSDIGTSTGISFSQF